jgi:hypothetical protein
MSEIAAFLSWRMCFKAPKVDVEGRNKNSMSNLSTALVIPDSLLAKEATDILHEHSTDLLFNHSIRVYLFAAEQGRQNKSSALTLNSSTWPPHFTISVS